MCTRYTAQAVYGTQRTSQAVRDKHTYKSYLGVSDMIFLKRGPVFNRYSGLCMRLLAFGILLYSEVPLSDPLGHNVSFFLMVSMTS